MKKTLRTTGLQQCRKCSPTQGLTIMLEPLMPSSETICMASFADESLHQIFLSDHFKDLTFFTNLNFPLFNAVG